MKPSETQGKLLKQAADGKSEALNELLNLHRDPLRRMIERRLDPAITARVDASDIVQESLLEAARRLTTFARQPHAPFGVWLRQIARDRIVDAYRRHRGAERRSVDREARSPLGEYSSVQLVDALSSATTTPQGAAMRRELCSRVEGALTQLTDDDREVILMRHLERLDNGEVARILELGTAAASMRYLRALRRLRGLLDQAGGDER